MFPLPVVFTSIPFCIFFSLFLLLFFQTPASLRKSLLLVANYLFYMSWKPELAVLLFSCTLIAYSCARAMQSSSPFFRKTFFTLGTLALLGVLFYFKYVAFLFSSANTLFQWLRLDWNLSIPAVLLPIGISFYTFLLVAYLVDVYREERAAEKNFVRFSCFATFFPIVISGPIERSDSLIPQLEKSDHARFDFGTLQIATVLILWGVFKKCVIADRLGILVDHVYQAPSAFHGFPLWLATYFYAFQIYCDFSGYSDMAVGIALILGIKLVINFKQPYLARSFPEFWTRWHISLANWLRDYVYIPLNSSETRRARPYFNMFLVFLVSGIWHGASWNFIIWGCLHGILYVSSSRISRMRLPLKLSVPLQILLTFHLVLFTWIFVRARDFHDAWTVVRHGLAMKNKTSMFQLGLSPYEMGIGALALLFLAAVELRLKDRSVLEWIESLTEWKRFQTAVILYLVLLLFMVQGNSSGFIYFQF